MASKKPSRTEAPIATDIPIREIRGQRVLLDSDLAAIYGVPTFRFNEAIKRNRDRFPGDFMFQLTPEESVSIRSQNAILKAGSLTSQNAISKAGRGGRRSLPFAFTEHGALQAANVLKSKRAVAMSVYVIRAFVQMREQIAANATILKRLAEIDKTLLEHDGALGVIWQKLQPLLNPPPALPKPRIGFKP
jgi:hypothetical protein